MLTPSMKNPTSGMARMAQAGFSASTAPEISSLCRYVVSPPALDPVMINSLALAREGSPSPGPEGDSRASRVAPSILCPRWYMVEPPTTTGASTSLERLVPSRYWAYTMLWLQKRGLRVQSGCSRSRAAYPDVLYRLLPREVLERDTQSSGLSHHPPPSKKMIHFEAFTPEPGLR